jgi:hypothetical protein
VVSRPREKATHTTGKRRFMGRRLAGCLRDYSARTVTMEVILLATEARRAILAGKTVGAARVATSMDRIRCGTAAGLSRVF